jgi:hypothetical protein
LSGIFADIQERRDSHYPRQLRKWWTGKRKRNFTTQKLDIPEGILEVFVLAASDDRPEGPWRAVAHLIVAVAM